MRRPARLTLATAWPRMGDGAVEAIAEWIEAATAPRLIIIDTLAKIKKPGARNGDRYADDYADVGEIKALADKHGVAVLAIHHVRKMMGDDILDEVSGSIGVTAAADTILVLKRDRGKADASLHVTGRDVDERKLGMKFDPATCRWLVIGDAKALRMSDQRRKVLDTLRGGQADDTDGTRESDEGEREQRQATSLQMAQEGEVKNNRGNYTPAITPITE